MSTQPMGEEVERLRRSEDVSPGRGRELQRVCELAELPPGGVVRVEVPEPIAVFNVEGELLAVGDTCTHEEASLSEGWREGTVIECPYHMARFCLRTGKPLCLPATEALATYRVVVADGVVWVEL